MTLRGFDPWRPERGERGLKLHYMLWLGKVYRALRAVNAGSVVVHRVSWGSVSAPPPFSLSLPLVRGPVGGQAAPSEFRALFGAAWRGEMLRSLRLKALPYLPWSRRRVASVSAVLTTNGETHALLQRTGAPRLFPFLDCGIPREMGLPVPPLPKEDKGRLKLLWAGRMEARKALPLALRALARLDVPVELWVAGDGPLREAWQAEAGRLGLDQRVRFLNRVPWNEMQKLFLEVDAFLFTSLRDSFGSVVLEAMAFGLPVIVPDHQGVGTFVPPEAGIKVPVTTPEDTVAVYARAMKRLAIDFEARHRMALAAWRFAQEERWDRRVDRVLTIYEGVLDGAHRRF